MKSRAKKLALALMVLTVTAGIWLNSMFQPEQLTILLITWFAATVWFVRIFFLGSEMQPVPSGMTSGPRWRVSITLVAYIWAIPAISVVQATSAGSRRAIIAMINNGGLLGVPGVLCLLGVPILTVLIPGYLKANGPAWNEESHAPGWLAGFAAFLTATYVVLLHLGKGALAGLPTGTLYFAAFGLVLILAPFYRAVASACWHHGSYIVLDPCCWWRSWQEAYNEMRGKGVAGSATTESSSIVIRESGNAAESR